MSFRLLFWLDEGGKGQPRKIGRAYLHGSSPKAIVTERLAKLDFITIDPTKEVIYYTESESGTVNKLFRFVLKMLCYLSFAGG